MNEIVNNALINFLNFLNNSIVNFKEIKFVVKNSDIFEELINDFYQANWEILVESVICSPGKEFLEIYGEGADCNSDSSRVSFPQKVATHQIVCREISSNFVKDIYTDGFIDLTLYKFNSFCSLIKELDDLDNYDAIILEHLIEDKYVKIKLDDISFIKVNVPN
jgi:hypothetical protein